MHCVEFPLHLGPNMFYGVEIRAVWGPELFRNTIVMKPLLNFPRSMDGTVVIHEKLVLAQRVDSGRLQQINIVSTLASFWGLQPYSRPIATYAAPNIIENSDVVFSIVFSGLYRVPWSSRHRLVHHSSMKTCIRC